MKNIKLTLALVLMPLFTACAHTPVPMAKYKNAPNNKEEKISATSIELTEQMIQNLKAKGVIKTK